MSTEPNAEWTPKTREDWVGLFQEAFTNGLTQHQSAKEEREAKEAAERAEKEGENDNRNNKPRSLGNRLLGI